MSLTLYTVHKTAPNTCIASTGEMRDQARDKDVTSNGPSTLSPANIFIHFDHVSEGISSTHQLTCFNSLPQLASHELPGAVRPDFSRMGLSASCFWNLDILSKTCLPWWLHDDCMIMMMMIIIIVIITAITITITMIIMIIMVMGEEGSEEEEVVMVNI